jgi:bifunctional non-homologous end joining protein LigD
VRRQHLEALFTKYKGTGDPALILTRTVPNARPLLTEARRKGWEGIMAKRTDAPYSMGQRSAAWLKLKLQHEQEFVVGGFTEPQRSRPKLGALHVGYYDRSGRTLHYAGLVGGGFTHDALRDMRQRLAPLERTTSPFSDRIARTPTPTHWVEPRVVVEVKFNEWTADGRLRQPVFLGIRDDKKPRDVVREASSIEEKS